MPMIHLQIPPLHADARSKLIDVLSTSLLRWREVPDTARARRNLWAFVQQYGAGDALDATQLPTRDLLALARVSVLAGVLDDRRKQGLVREFTAALQEAYAGAALRAWVIVEEVPEGNWGADGAITSVVDAQLILGVRT